MKDLPEGTDHVRPDLLILIIPLSDKHPDYVTLREPILIVMSDFLQYVREELHHFLSYTQTVVFGSLHQYWQILPDEFPFEVVKFGLIFKLYLGETVPQEV